MKIVAAEQEPIIGIPLIVGIAIVGIQPEAVIVPLDVEDVRIAIGVHLMRATPTITAL